MYATIVCIACVHECRVHQSPPIHMPPSVVAVPHSLCIWHALSGACTITALFLTLQWGHYQPSLQEPPSHPHWSPQWAPVAPISLRLAHPPHAVGVPRPQLAPPHQVCCHHHSAVHCMEWSSLTLLECTRWTTTAWLLLVTALFAAHSPPPPTLRC